MPDNHWSTSVQNISNGVCVCLLQDSASLPVVDMLKLLASNALFADWYSTELAASEFEAFYWELPAISLNASHRASEFVLLDAPALAAQHPDRQPFDEHFRRSDGDIAVFSSLGGDAQLIAPCPIANNTSHTHLAAFVRQAPALQIQHFWHTTAATALTLLGEKPLWLSTSGLGVSWLHARLDQQPKYFQHQPYKAPA